MGYRPSTNLNLPQHMRKRVRGAHTYYYFDTGARPRKEIPLGTDYFLALQKYANAHPELASAIEKFRFYDLRAKAADDTSDERGEQAASDLLGHENVKTTQRHYLRPGRIVPPTK